MRNKLFLFTTLELVLSHKERKKKITTQATTVFASHKEVWKAFAIRTVPCPPTIMKTGSWWGIIQPTEQFVLHLSC